MHYHHEKSYRPGHHGHPLQFKGLLPIPVLSLVKDGPAHGGEIYQTLREKFGIEAARPVIYTLLRRLERAGLILSSWDIPDSGPATRKYTITDEGLEYLNSSLKELKKLGAIIGQLTAEKG